MADCEQASSLSKGCFVHLPSGAQAKKGGKLLQEANCFHPHPGETADDAARRHAAFKDCWEETRRRVEGLMVKEHDQLFERVIQFVKQSHSKMQSHKVDQKRPVEKEIVPSFDIRPHSREIPTAALLAGMNMPDHEAMFQRLSEELVSKVTPFVVRLNSRKCINSMKATLQEVLQQLMGVQEHPDTEGEMEGEGPRPAKQRRLANCTMAVFRSWYQEMVQSGMDPSGVVIVIEDFEGFPPQLLQSLITGLSGSIHVVPTVLLFVIATSTAAVHNSLTQAASSSLSIEQFAAQSPLAMLNTIVEEVLLDPDLPLGLGGGAHHYLVQHFLCSSLSTKELQRGLQFATMEHFTWLAVSVLCVSAEKFPEAVEQLTDNHMEMVRALPSFQKYVEAQSAEARLSLLEDSEATKRALCDLVQKIRDYRANLRPFLKVLLCLLRPLPETPLGLKLYQLCSHCLGNSVTESTAFQSAWLYIRVLGEKELTKCLMEAVKCVEQEGKRMERPTAAMANFCQRVTAFCDALSAVNTEDSTSQRAGRGCSGETKLTEAATTSERKLLLEEHLKQRNTRSKQSSLFTSLRSDIIDYLLILFKDHLAPPTVHACHEVFFFDQAEWLSQHLNPSPRIAVQTALSRPQTYLPSCDAVDPDLPLSRSLPDITVAYHLHLECGRLINLYDWMQAFIAVVAPEHSSSDDKNVDKALYDRFMQAVAELQFLGFVQQSKRKTDHVQRMTWGTC